MALKYHDVDDEERDVPRKKRDSDSGLNKFKNYLLILFFTLSLFMVGFLSFNLAKKMYTKPEPVIDSQYISSKLDEASNLTTAVLTYNGLITYSDGSIPFITKKSFSMIYSAEIRAGIDMSKVDITVTEDKVIVRLPEVEVQSVNVDPDSIQFYDEKYALFNWSDKDDVVTAISSAEADVTENADINGLKEKSRVQAEEIIKGLLIDSIGERTLEIK